MDDEELFIDRINREEQECAGCGRGLDRDTVEVAAFAAEWTYFLWWCGTCLHDGTVRANADELAVLGYTGIFWRARMRADFAQVNLQVYLDEVTDKGGRNGSAT